MKNALLLINLGTPKSTDPQDVGAYLTEFLTDGDVIDLPWPLRQFLVRALIVPKRKYQAANNYKKIWRPEGSPLLVNTKYLVDKLQASVQDKFFVTYAMRYAGPSIEDRMNELKREGYNRIYAMPVYPHDTKSSVATVVKKINQAAKKLEIEQKVSTIPPFYRQNFYLEATTHLIKQVLSEQTDAQTSSHQPFVLFSYHGIPQNHLPKACLNCPQDRDSCEHHVPIADCYRAQCLETSHLMAKKLNLSEDQYMSAFQSRLGKRPWIKPYSDQVIRQLSERGVRNLIVATPSFIADCLETLEEVALGFKEDFEELGPDHRLTAVPCLNDNDYFVEQFSRFVSQL